MVSQNVSMCRKHPVHYTTCLCVPFCVNEGFWERLVVTPNVICKQVYAVLNDFYPSDCLTWSLEKYHTRTLWPAYNDPIREPNSFVVVWPLLGADMGSKRAQRDSTHLPKWTWCVKVGHSNAKYQVSLQIRLYSSLVLQGSTSHFFHSTQKERKSNKQTNRRNTLTFCLKNKQQKKESTEKNNKWNKQINKQLDIKEKKKSRDNKEQANMLEWTQMK